MSRSARIFSPCSKQGPMGLDAHSSPSIPWCPSQPGAGTGGITDRAHMGHGAGGRLSRYGPGQEQMEMESRVHLICQVTHGLHTGQEGRQGKCQQPATAASLPFFSLICLRGLLYSPHLSCTEVVVLVEGGGPQGS